MTLTKNSLFEDVAKLGFTYKRANASPQLKPQMIGVPSTLFASFSSIALRPSPLPCAASISAVVGGSSIDQGVGAVGLEGSY